MKNRKDLTRHLMRWDIIDKRHVAIQQFKEGLNYMGFLDSVKSHPLLKSLFVFSKEYSVSAQYLQKCFDNSLEKLEAKNDSEIKTKKFFKQLLKEINGKKISSL